METQKHKGSRIVQKKKEEKIEGLTLQHYKTCHKATVIKDCANSVETDMLISWVKYGQILDRCARASHWGKDYLFNRWCGNDCIYTYKQIINLELHLRTYTEINSDQKPTSEKKTVQPVGKNRSKYVRHWISKDMTLKDMTLFCSRYDKIKGKLVVWTSLK